ncbi:MAG TPA: hypothetical protein DCE41_24635, partial [Cytophagales bacterium]|nr:hypothetical protein [Cytophagales bacterium]
AAIEFAYHIYSANGYDIGELELQANGTTIWSVGTSQGNQWNVANVDLSAYAGSTVNLTFRGGSGSSWQSDFAIDAVKLTSDSGSASFMGIGGSEIPTGADFTMYPNPTQGTLNLQNLMGDKTTISVWDMAGRQLMSAVATGADHTLDVSALKQGMYVLRINDGGEVSTAKFVKE